MSPEHQEPLVDLVHMPSLPFPVLQEPLGGLGPLELQEHQPYLPSLELQELPVLLVDQQFLPDLFQTNSVKN